MQDDDEKPWIVIVSPHSKRKKDQNNERFFEALEKAFLDFLFFEFCEIEELKEFIRKFELKNKSKKMRFRFLG